MNDCPGIAPRLPIERGPVDPCLFADAEHFGLLPDTELRSVCACGSAMGTARPGTALQAMPPLAHSPGSRGPSVAKSPGVEWLRDELQTRARPIERCRDGDELVRSKSMDRVRRVHERSGSDLAARRHSQEAQDRSIVHTSTQSAGSWRFSSSIAGLQSLRASPPTPRRSPRLHRPARWRAALPALGWNEDRIRRDTADASLQ